MSCVRKKKGADKEKEKKNKIPAQHSRNQSPLSFPPSQWGDTGGKNSPSIVSLLVFLHFASALFLLNLFRVYLGIFAVEL